jgi:predicted CoA-binding protein
MRNVSQRVVVLGASDKPERYSHQAVRLLLEYGHQVVPVHPSLHSVAGLVT